MGWSLGSPHPAGDSGAFRELLFLPSFIWHLTGSSDAAYLQGSITQSQVSTCQQESCCASFRITMSSRHQDMVLASELCRGILTTSVLVRSL